MSVDSQIQSPKATPAVRQPVQGFAPQSVTVFALGLVGFLVPLLGFIPSVLAVTRSRMAHTEIRKSKGHLRGQGLIRAGVAFGWLGILTTVVSVGACLALWWALQSTPGLLPSLLGLSGQQSTLDPTAILSFLDTQDLNALLSDPEVIGELEQRLRDAGVDPETLFSPSPEAPRG